MTDELVPAVVDAPDQLLAGREALRRHAWQAAYDLLSDADRAAALSGADLEALAEAAFFSAKGGVETEVRERAFKAHLMEGDKARAAYIAFTLARLNGYQGKLSIAAAWAKRGERLLDGQPETYAQGYLELARAEGARAVGNLEAGIESAKRAMEIGERVGDDELRAWALTALGTMRIASGLAPDGLALLEEASIAAVSGELSAFASGVICCTMIAACRNLTDYERASEWIEATDRYCQRQSVAGFPGACRIHRAEIAAVGGNWERAEHELVQATGELAAYEATPPVADGYYALGDVRRLEGNLVGAEEALRQAHALGRSPQPALALIRLAEGKTRAAVTAIETALAEPTRDSWIRGRLLSAQVEIAIAVGDRERARAAADELAGIVVGYPTPALEAGSHAAQGRVLLAEGNAATAATELRTAIERWRAVGSSYEASRCRVLLSQALRALGDEEGADLELQAARDEFERLGAKVDLAAAERLRRDIAERSAAPLQVRRTFMFTDIVGSTKLAEALGDEAWESLLRWHDRTLRDLFERSGGEVVNTTGDGYFVAFESAARAIECAAAIQRALSEHRASAGFALSVRIGLHTARANRHGADYSGTAVHVAARVAALAAGGQILATAETLAEIPGTTATDRRDVALKGVSSLTSIGTIVWA